MLSAYGRFVDGGYRETFADLWNRYDILRGQPVTLLEGGRRITGVAGGIDDEGSLLIRGENGRPQRFHAGEVTLEKASRRSEGRRSNARPALGPLLRLGSRPSTPGS